MPQVSDEAGHYRPLVTCDDEGLKTHIRETVLLAWQTSSAREQRPADKRGISPFHQDIP
jgi:hypothetical protein